jgi:hypothetical protein
MTEAIIETSKIEIIIPKERIMGISICKKEASILKPTKESTIANPTLRNLNNPIIPETAKYRERNPNIANMFDVYTINVSLLIARIAGMLSTAKIRSVDSTTSNTRNKGVATSLLFCLTNREFP